MEEREEKEREKSQCASIIENREKAEPLTLISDLSFTSRLRQLPLLAVQQRITSPSPLYPPEPPEKGLSRLSRLFLFVEYTFN